jgi:hypothetical protein
MAQNRTLFDFAPLLKLKIGVRYRFYFKQDDKAVFGGDHLNTILNGDLLLGCDVVG